MAEFRYYFQVLDQDELTAIQDELLYKYGASCDASAPPANGEVGDCTNELMSGYDVPAHVRHRLHTLR